MLNVIENTVLCAVRGWCEVDEDVINSDHNEELAEPHIVADSMYTMKPQIEGLYGSALGFILE